MTISSLEPADCANVVLHPLQCAKKAARRPCCSGAARHLSKRVCCTQTRPLSPQTTGQWRWGVGAVRRTPASGGFGAIRIGHIVIRRGRVLPVYRLSACDTCGGAPLVQKASRGLLRARRSKLEKFGREARMRRLGEREPREREREREAQRERPAEGNSRFRAAAEAGRRRARCTLPQTDSEKRECAC